MAEIELMSTTSGLTAARRLARALNQHDKKLVLTESCTGGLIASWLTRIAGVSAHFCGSAVVYRNETKQAWLDVPRELLDRRGPVSKDVAEAMVRGVLAATPEADVAASITGHFGPDAPAKQDGLFFVGIGERMPAGVTVHRYRFPAGSNDKSPLAVRRERQQHAGRIVCELLIDRLSRR